MSAGRTLLLSLAVGGLGLSLPAQAFAYALTCDTYKKYGYLDKTYYTNDSGVASRCGYAFDKKSCTFTSSTGNCRWEGSFARTAAPPVAPPAPTPTPATSSSETIGKIKPAASSPSLNQGFFPFPKFQPPKNTTEEEEAGDQGAPTTLPPSSTATAPASEDPGASSALLAEAKREAGVAAEKMEEMQSTMADIRIMNEQNAVRYRAPDADLQSLAHMYNGRNAGLSGVLASNEAGSENRKKNVGQQEKGRHLASEPGAKGTETGAAEISSAAEAAADSPASASASDDPWLNYLSETSKSAWIERLRGNSSLRDALQARIAELQSQSGSANEGLIDFLEELLTESVGEEPASLKNLLPIPTREAFSMDSKETEAEIRGLLADLNVPSDPQFLPQESLFERVSFAHRRSLVRGSLKP